ncbi:auxin-binding protein ABP19a-like [Chenopodium quinoa]|uniref:Germin-like protein n=1 Tax=Chenopodium quinoa TaxID=63459 RepID=A0A803MG43_CHEQI|nr:auxin-binding protein ABP19a-like [Chenopodium quinoa]
MTYFAIFLLLSLFSIISQAQIVEDFCVADYTLPSGPAGYSCKNSAKVTFDDFVFTGLSAPGDTKNIYKAFVTPAFSSEFAAFNGLGLAMARLDFALDGVIALHVHRTSEVLVLAQGEIIAGFISTSNTAYYKKLKVGDIMVFPQSLLHFQLNVGKTPAVAFVTLNSAKPGLQFIDNSLFAGNFPTDLAVKTMLLDDNQVKKLKKAFGGKH